MIAAVAAIVGIVVVVGGVVWSQVAKQKAVTGDGKAVPAGATMGGPYRAFAEVTAKPGAPTLDVYEDYQCPACKQFEGILGATITELAKAGDITLNYHTLNFLDRQLGNDGSVTAGNGVFCAADAGKYQEFHDLAFTNQPAEGVGWSVATLKPLATQAGISGAALDTWSDCVKLGKYSNYIKAVNDEAFSTGKVNKTPTFKLNGTIIENTKLGTPDALKAAVAAATTK